MISPRCGTRPTSETTRPPSVSISSSPSSGARAMPVCSLKSSRSRRASATIAAVVAATCSCGASSTSCSSSMSPTISSIEVLDRDEAVGAAIFVDDERQMDMRRLHLEQQISAGMDGGTNRSSRLIWRSARPGSCRLPSGCDSRSAEDVLDVHEAERDRRASRDRRAGANAGPRGTSAISSGSGVFSSTATISARGTITSSTRSSPNLRRLASMMRSCGVSAGLWRSLSSMTSSRLSRIRSAHCRRAEAAPAASDSERPLSASSCGMVGASWRAQSTSPRARTA